MADKAEQIAQLWVEVLQSRCLHPVAIPKDIACLLSELGPAKAFVTDEGTIEDHMAKARQAMMKRMELDEKGPEEKTNLNYVALEDQEGDVRRILCFVGNGERSGGIALLVAALWNLAIEIIDSDKSLRLVTDDTLARNSTEQG